MSEETAPYTSQSRVRIAVFAREPRLGQVKSRLAAQIGEPAALAVYQAMLARVGSLLASSGIAEWDLWVTSNPDHESFLSLCNKTNIYQQKGRDLGAKMHYTIEQSLGREDTDALILIGTDCPALTGAYLSSAVLALGSGSDVVLGPAEDGGYVLVGARRPVPTLFEGISWGSDRVMSQTLARLKEGEIGYRLLDTLWDVDRPEDLERVQRLEPPLDWDMTAVVD